MELYGVVSRQQKIYAKELLDEINSTIKGAANGDEAWGTAFQSLLESEAKALSMRKLPIIQGLANDGKFKELMKKDCLSSLVLIKDYINLT